MARFAAPHYGRAMDAYKDPRGAAGRALHHVPEQGIVLRVLGDVEVTGSHGTVAFGGTRPGAVFALLAIDAGECVPVDRLLDELWRSGAAPCDVKRVQVNVLRLRRAIARVAPDIDAAAVVRRRASGYALQIEGAVAVDAVRFADLVARGRRELGARDPGRAATTLRCALALWRGEPYADYAYEPFVAVEARRLEELRRDAVELSVEARLAVGEHAAVAGELERLVSRDPLRERLHALRMVALHRCGRQGDALSAYRAARAALVETLGIEPGSELRRLQRAILDGSACVELDDGAARRPPATGDQAA